MKSPFLLFLLHSTAPFVIIWKAWGYSSAGRAFEWHSKGQRFDPAYLHHAFNPPHLADVVLFIHSPHRNKWLTRFHASLCSFEIGSLLNRFDPAYLHHAFNPPHLSDVVLFIHSPHRSKVTHSISCVTLFLWNRFTFCNFRNEIDILGNMLIHTGTDSKKERRILYHIPKIRLKI